MPKLQVENIKNIIPYNLIITILFSMLIISCNTEKKVEKKDNFNKEFTLQWDKYLLNIEKIIKLSNDKKTLLKVKTDMIALYVEGRDEYDGFPEDIAIRVSRLSEKIDEKIRPKILKSKHYFKSIDIISNKIEKIEFFGAKDDGTSTKFTEKDLKGKFIWPLKKIYVTSPYGFRNDPFKKDKIGFHHGVDLSGKIGNYISSSNYGRVVFSGKNGGYGLMVMISHYDNILTIYGHLSKIYVATGSYVKRGELIGEVGSTGKSTGPHLHFEVRRNNRSIDPIFFIESQGIR